MEKLNQFYCNLEGNLESLYTIVNGDVNIDKTEQEKFNMIYNLFFLLIYIDEHCDKYITYLEQYILTNIFITESPKDRIDRDELYKHYCNWMDNNNFTKYILKKQQFTEHLHIYDSRIKFNTRNRCITHIKLL